MSIEQKRQEIDTIDTAIVDLLNKRADVARDISLLKAQAGLPVTDVGRERDVLRRLTQMRSGLIDAGVITGIYKIILEESRRIQTRVRAEIAASGVSL